METGNNNNSSIAASYNIIALFNTTLDIDCHPQEVFHHMLQTFISQLPTTLNGKEVSREVLIMGRRITDLLIENEFEITYA